MQELSRTKTALLVAFLVLVWGINWPLSKFALSFTPPVLFSGMRTLLGGLVFYKLIGSGDASKVASFTFLIPLVAILAGTIFLHEPFTLYLLAGLALIVSSIYLVNRKPGKSAARS